MDIKAVRREMGLTQRKFADVIRVDPSTISNWECGRSEPGEQSIFIIELELRKFRRRNKRSKKKNTGRVKSGIISKDISVYG